MKYQHGLGILNKSFSRDLKRSINLYQSFEKYVLNQENIPFFIVIPAKDLERFKEEFQSMKNQKLIKKLPILLRTHLHSLR